MRNLLFALLFISSILSSCSKDKNTDTPSTGETLTNLSDVSYGSGTDYLGKDASKSYLLDIYFPPKATTTQKYPLYFYVHGGGFLYGDKAKADAVTLCKTFSDSGYVAVSINYRMGYISNGDPNSCKTDTVSYKKAAYRAIQDAHAAMRYLVHNADKYAIDVNKIFLAGESAGGGTVLHLAYLTDAVAQYSEPKLVSELGAISKGGNKLTEAFDIKAICNMWGALTDSTLINAAKKYPTINFHGTNDAISPYDIGNLSNCTNYPKSYGSFTIHRQLERQQVPVKTNLFKGGGHGPEEYKTAFSSNLTLCFFRSVLNNSAKTGLYYDLKGSCD